MKRLYEEFGKEGIAALVPWQFYKKTENPQEWDSIWASNHHNLEIVAKCSTEAQLLRVASGDIAYVVNPSGYIGVNSSIDIGYALGKRVPVYAMEEISDVGVNVLIDGVKTPEEIILMGKGLYKSKYRPLRRHFARHIHKKTGT